MSFSSGTIIGEISLLRPMNSIAAIRCASVCELHTLNLPGFYRVLQLFPEKHIAFRSLIRNRIAEAKVLLEEMRAANKVKGDSIIWMKNKWNELYEIQARKAVLHYKSLQSFLY